MKKAINEQLGISESSPIKVRFFSYQHFTYPWHFHSEYELIYIKKGRGTAFVGNGLVRFNDDVCLFMGSNLPHYMRSDKEYFVEDCNLLVEGVIIQFEKDFMNYAIANYPHFDSIRNFLKQSIKGYFFYNLSHSNLDALIQKLVNTEGVERICNMLELLDKMSVNKHYKFINTAKTVEIEHKSISRIDKVLSFLNQHYTRHITLTEIASVAAMNQTAFCRYFKGEMGKSFKNFLIEMRINYACKLLLDDSLNISQVSSSCGFDSTPYFNTCFKKVNGTTPSSYRKLHSPK